MKADRQEKNKIAFESLDILVSRWKNGTFYEILDDWKWILTYSARYKKQIMFYTFFYHLIYIWITSF